MTIDQLLNLYNNFEIYHVDDSFDHAFGTQHGYHVEVNCFKPATGIVTDNEFEAYLTTSYEGGGCQYEFDLDDCGEDVRVRWPHKCGQTCKEWIVRIKWELVSAFATDEHVDKMTDCLQYNVTYRPRSVSAEYQ